MNPSYPSNLTSQQWELLSGLIPEGKKGGRKRSVDMETATMGSKDVGYDSGKKIKGRKRHILVDTLGLLIVVVITAADVSEQAGAKQVLSKLHQVRQRMGRLIRI